MSAMAYAERGENWGMGETDLLLQHWGDPAVQSAMLTTIRNLDIYNDIADKMHGLMPSFARTGLQCRYRIKRLKRDFLRAKNEGSKRSFPFYDQMDAVLTQRAVAAELAKEANPGRRRRKKRNRSKKKQQPPMVVPKEEAEDAGFGLPMNACDIKIEIDNAEEYEYGISKANGSSGGGGGGVEQQQPQPGYSVMASTSGTASFIGRGTASSYHDDSSDEEDEDDEEEEDGEEDTSPSSPPSPSPIIIKSVYHFKEPDDSVGGGGTTTNTSYQSAMKAIVEDHAKDHVEEETKKGMTGGGPDKDSRPAETEERRGEAEAASTGTDLAGLPNVAQQLDIIAEWTVKDDQDMHDEDDDDDDADVDYSSAGVVSELESPSRSTRETRGSRRKKAEQAETNSSPAVSAVTSGSILGELSGAITSVNVVSSHPSSSSTSLLSSSSSAKKPQASCIFENVPRFKMIEVGGIRTMVRIPDGETTVSSSSSLLGPGVVRPGVSLLTSGPRGPAALPKVLVVDRHGKTMNIDAGKRFGSYGHRSTTKLTEMQPPAGFRIVHGPLPSSSTTSTSTSTPATSTVRVFRTTQGTSLLSGKAGAKVISLTPVSSSSSSSSTALTTTAGGSAGPQPAVPPVSKPLTFTMLSSLNPTPRRMTVSPEPSHPNPHRHALSSSPPSPVKTTPIKMTNPPLKSKPPSTNTPLTKTTSAIPLPPPKTTTAPAKTTIIISRAGGGGGGGGAAPAAKTETCQGENHHQQDNPSPKATPESKPTLKEVKHTPKEPSAIAREPKTEPMSKPHVCKTEERKPSVTTPFNTSDDAFSTGESVKTGAKRSYSIITPAARPCKQAKGECEATEAVILPEERTSVSKPLVIRCAPPVAVRVPQPVTSASAVVLADPGAHKPVVVSESAIGTLLRSRTVQHETTTTDTSAESSADTVVVLPRQGSSARLMKPGAVKPVVVSQAGNRKASTDTTDWNSAIERRVRNRTAQQETTSMDNAAMSSAADFVAGETIIRRKRAWQQETATTTTTTTPDALPVSLDVTLGVLSGQRPWLTETTPGGIKILYYEDDKTGVRTTPSDALHPPAGVGDRARDGEAVKTEGSPRSPTGSAGPHGGKIRRVTLTRSQQERAEKNRTGKERAEKDRAENEAGEEEDEVVEIAPRLKRKQQKRRVIQVLDEHTRPPSRTQPASGSNLPNTPERSLSSTLEGLLTASITSDPPFQRNTPVVVERSGIRTNSSTSSSTSRTTATPPSAAEAAPSTDDGPPAPLSLSSLSQKEEDGLFRLFLSQTDLTSECKDWMIQTLQSRMNPTTESSASLQTPQPRLNSRESSASLQTPQSRMNPQDSSATIQTPQSRMNPQDSSASLLTPQPRRNPRESSASLQTPQSRINAQESSASQQTLQSRSIPAAGRLASSAPQRPVDSGSDVEVTNLVLNDGGTQSDRQTGTFKVKAGLAQMAKGGIIMDVTTPEEARIAEEAGACAVMALERVPADIRREGGVARMTDPTIIKAIMETVTIPVMAKCRIGHFAEAQILESLGVDMVDESEVLTPADEEYHVDKHAFKVPFVCGARDLGEALRRVSEGAAMIRTKGEAGTGDVVEAVRHARTINRQIRTAKALDPSELYQYAKDLRVPYDLLKKTAELGRLPVVNFAAGGLATPADVSLLLQLGVDGVFVGSGIFKSSDPPSRARAMAGAVTHYKDPKILADLSDNLGPAMFGTPVSQRMREAASGPGNKGQEKLWNATLAMDKFKI